MMGSILPAQMKVLEKNLKLKVKFISLKGNDLLHVSGSANRYFKKILKINRNLFLKVLGRVEYKEIFQKLFTNKGACVLLWDT